MKQLKYCPHCHRRMMSNKHYLTKSLAKTLHSVCCEFGIDEKFHLQKDLSLTKNQYNNFQKLKYWLLVKREGKGYWSVTKTALNFFQGRPLPRFVVTFNGIIQEYSDEKITMENVVGHYDIPEKWAERQVWVDEDLQLSLI